MADISWIWIHILYCKALRKKSRYAWSNIRVTGILTINNFPFAPKACIKMKVAKTSTEPVHFAHPCVTK